MRILYSIFWTISFFYSCKWIRDKMFEYFLIIFGINLKNKVFGHIITGLTFAIFSSLLIRYFFLFKINDNLNSILFKLFLSSIYLLNLITYSVIKFKSQKILELNAKIKTYCKVYFVNQLNIYKPFIIAVIVWILSVTFFTLFRLSDDSFDSTSGILLFERRIGRSNRFCTIFFMITYVHLWKILFHLIYNEMNNNYLSILKEFNKEMKRKITFPDITVIRMTDRTILNFIELQTSLRKNVNFIKYFIIIDSIATGLFMITWLICSQIPAEKTSSFLLALNYIIFYYLYQFWILFKVNRSKKYENEIKSHVNRWQKITFNDRCIVELDILERSVKIFTSNNWFIETITTIPQNSISCWKKLFKKKEFCHWLTKEHKWALSFFQIFSYEKS